mmetsp:Transcript_72028/g.114191  ORF Transcript_72028/g.114191 Transcript_72028/m.114191 type:complete len:321 (-) Transcript_72028:162-1124(-)
MEDEEVINIVLDDDVSVALCRRGKRKLRDIEASSCALLKMDSTKKGLEIRGSPACVADARRKIENLSGIKLDARPVVWAELMRTRMSTDITAAAIANIQETSGCRIHVKRDSAQIQLFGPRERTHVAAQLIEHLALMCGEVRVGTQTPISEDKLHVLARQFGVTLVVEQAHINVLGIKGAVVAAARDLLFLGQDVDLNEKQRRAESAHEAIEKAFSDLKAVAVTPLISSCCASFTAGSDGTTEEGKSFTEGSQDTECDVHDQNPCSVCGSLPFCAQCGARAQKMDEVYKGTCPACSISRFCVHCGCEFFKRQTSASTDRG